jgi:hypothetical protein
VKWPPRSPDLNTMDFLLMGFRDKSMSALLTPDSNLGTVCRMQQSRFVSHVGHSNMSDPRSYIVLKRVFMTWGEFRTFIVTCVNPSSVRLYCFKFRGVGIKKGS